MPAWAGVVSAVSLAVIALAAVAAAAGIFIAGRRAASFIDALERVAGPALADVQRLVGAIRTEAEGIAGTSRDLRTRVVHAADAAQARLAELSALLDVVQEEVEGATVDVAATIRAVRRGVAAISWGGRVLARRRKRR